MPDQILVLKPGLQHLVGGRALGREIDRQPVPPHALDDAALARGGVQRLDEEKRVVELVGNAFRPHEDVGQQSVAGVVVRVLRRRVDARLAQFLGVTPEQLFEVLPSDVPQIVLVGVPARAIAHVFFLSLTVDIEKPDRPVFLTG